MMRALPAGLIALLIARQLPRGSWWWKSLVLGMASVALVVLGPDAAMSPLGILAGLGGAASMGTGVVLTKRWGRPAGVSPIGLAGWQLTAAGLVLLLPALLVDGVPPGSDGTAWLGYA